MPKSYRIISLHTSDVKILAKVLANRLSKYIATLIHLDQSGFIPLRTTAMNIRHLFLKYAITYGQCRCQRYTLFKAFDSVEWKYLWAVLTAFGIGPGYLAWLYLLYDKPIAKLRLNNTLFSTYSLSRGTTQGCPLSLLFFAMAIEPLALAIRQTPEIIVFRRAAREDKIALYADDALFSLGYLQLLNNGHKFYVKIWFIFGIPN